MDLKFILVQHENQFVEDLKLAQNRQSIIVNIWGVLCHTAFIWQCNSKKGLLAIQTHLIFQQHSL